MKKKPPYADVHMAEEEARWRMRSTATHSPQCQYKSHARYLGERQSAALQSGRLSAGSWRGTAFDLLFFRSVLNLIVFH